MSQPEAFHIPAGARVEWRQANRKVQGEVVCYRAIGQRQVLTVRRSDGELVSLMAEKAKALPADAPASADPIFEILTPPLARSEAEGIARTIVAGGAASLRMPVNQVINLLATALVEALDRPSEGL